MSLLQRDPVYEPCMTCQWYGRTPEIIDINVFRYGCNYCASKGDDWIDAMLIQKGLKEPVSPYPKHNKAYELTFTTSRDDLADLIARMTKVLNSKMLGAIHYYIGFELTENKLPHAHCLILSSKRKIEYSKLRTIFDAQNVGALHTSPVKDIKKFHDYIRKQHGELPVINYFAEKNVPLYIDTDGIRQETFICAKANIPKAL